MLRLGLCCLFRDKPIRFRDTTAAAVGRMPRPAALAKLSELCRANAAALAAALQYCADHSIGCFRITSRILPLKTHPRHGYMMEDLPNGADIVRQFRECGDFARSHNLRTAFHPDQFVVLNSPRPEVVEASVREVEYQAEVAEWVGADVLNVHGGGAFGDKPKALADFARSLGRLSPRARSRLTVENDDRIFTPADLLPVCRSEGVPLVYDAHHHRCNGDGLTVEAATEAALATWDREPLFHLSSPIEGWDGPHPERHHDFIDVADFPACWLGLDLTVEVEAKAKEAAVLRLLEALRTAAAGRTRKEKGAMFDYALDFEKIDFRLHPELYRIGKGEQGVLLVEPYKGEILPHWRFKTAAEAKRSAAAIYKMFLAYLRAKDFPGADMARKFLQMGWTRARRYANHKGGRKYDATTGAALPRGDDPEKAAAAAIFYDRYVAAREHPSYVRQKEEHRRKHEAKGASPHSGGRGSAPPPARQR